MGGPVGLLAQSQYCLMQERYSNADSELNHFNLNALILYLHFYFMLKFLVLKDINDLFSSITYNTKTIGIVNLKPKI